MGNLVFLNYDRAALDREYDNQKKVPNYAASRERQAAASQAVRASFPCRLDVAYGEAPRERLDIFLPSGGEPAPVHVFIHGGYWQRNDKSGSSFVARTLVPVGAACVVLNYPLVPSVTLDAVVGACRRAVAWLYRNASSFQGDPERLSVSGHSAGGHLAAMLLATDWAAYGLPAGVVKTACGISGLYHLEPVRLCYLNDVLQLDEPATRRNSPVLLKPPPSGQLLLAVGGEEGPEFHRQVTALAAAWGPAIPCQVLDLPGQDHFSLVEQLGDPDAALSRALVSFLGLD